MSLVPPFTSPGTKLEAFDKNATKRPSALTTGCWLVLLPIVPDDDELTSVVVLLTRSRSKTSGTPLVSPETRLEAYDANTTNRHHS